MDEVAIPTYEVLGEVHRFAFPDGTSLAIQGLQRDRAGHLWATVEANAGEDALVNRARIDLLNLQDRQRFHATAAGDGSIDWQGRLAYVAAHLDAGGETLTRHRDWEPPVPFDEFGLPPFPTDALPNWLRDFVEAEARATQTPPDLAAMQSLSCLGACCAKTVEVLVKEGYREPVNVFTMTALPPGNRKSQVFHDTIAPLEEREAEQAEALRNAIAEAQNRYKILEQALQKAQADAARAGPDARAERTQAATALAQELAAARVPVPPRLVADDTSAERLATLMQEQGGRMAVMSPEGDAFELMAGRYSNSNNGAPNFAVYLKGHAGDTLRVDRVKRPPEYVQKPALTLGLAVQPDVLRGLMKTPGFRGRGLLGRFLYALPRSWLGARDTDPPSVAPAVRAHYRDRIRALLHLQPGADAAGHPTPHLLQLSPAARARIRAFAAWLEPQLAEFGALGHMADWAGKLAGAAVRVMGLLHMAAHAGDEAPWATPIHGATAESAIRIAHYLIPHARAAFAEMGGNPVVQDARHLLGWIQRQEAATVTKREIFEGTKGRFPRVSALEPAIALLVEHGFLRERPQEDRPGPGRKPSPVYEVHPFWRSHQSTQVPGHADSANPANLATVEGSAVILAQPDDPMSEEVF
jgi:replicative DNA helicase